MEKVHYFEMVEAGRTPNKLRKGCFGGGMEKSSVKLGTESLMNVTFP